MTVRQLATWSGVFSPRTLRRAIQAGELQAIRGYGPGGGRPQYRIELAAAIAYLKLRHFDPQRVRILERVLARHDERAGQVHPDF